MNPLQINENTDKLNIVLCPNRRKPHNNDIISLTKYIFLFENKKFKQVTTLLSCLLKKWDNNVNDRHLFLNKKKLRYTLK